MHEIRQFEEADLPSFPEAEKVEDLGSEAVMAERLTPLIDRVIKSVDIPTLQEELHLPKPEEVLDKVVEAAEHNQAIERLLERSHEIKDDSTAPVPPGNVTPLSQLLQSRSQTLPTPQQTHTNRQQGRIQRLLHDKSLYGHAVRYGFVTAICSLVVAVLVVLLFT